MIEFDQGAKGPIEIEIESPEESVEPSSEVKADIDTGTEESVEEIEEKDLLVVLQDQLNVASDKHLRLAAEYQNYRKRTIQDFSRKLEQGRSEIALAVLPVLDDLRRSLGAAEDSEDPFVQGVQLVFDKFNNELSKYRIAKMEVEGELFSEEEHEALQFIPAPDGTEEGTIIAEVQPGYTIGDRILRHAQVIVAKAVDQEKPEERADENEESAGSDEAIEKGSE